MSRDSLYRAIQGVHNLYFSDLQIGEFLNCFFYYIENKTQYSLSFITNDEMMGALESFIRDNLE